MIMHPTRWQRGRLAAACCAAQAALTTSRPPRDEPAADGITATRVGLVTEATVALGMLTGLWVAPSPFVVTLPSGYRPTAANRVPMRWWP